MKPVARVEPDLPANIRWIANVPPDKTFLYAAPVAADPEFVAEAMRMASLNQLDALQAHLEGR